MQESKLLSLLAKNSRTKFGREHRFSEIKTFKDFQRAVPLCSYTELAPYLDDIKYGSEAVLTAERVERLHLTSGTGGINKLLPFTPSLRSEFFAGIGPWLMDLSKRFPDAMSGPSHWVVSPPCAPPFHGASAVPIGFDDDASYLPRCLHEVMSESSVVPKAVGQISDKEEFYYLTGLFLAQRRELSFLSMWSPSYLTLVLESLIRNRERLLEDLHNGACVYVGEKERREEIVIQKSVARARELEKALPQELDSIAGSNWSAVWPRLSLISCWSDGWSRRGAERLTSMFPAATLQGKGLLATEGFITLPYGDDTAPVLSICSHVFEFLIPETGEVNLAHELAEGAEYEVVITTAGGLYRYRLQDLVRCEGFLQKTPRLRFLGRSGVVSDLCGEKLDGLLVEQSIDSILLRNHLSSEVAFIAPIAAENLPCYGFYLDSNETLDDTRVAKDLDLALRESYYYDQCRRAGQLGPLTVKRLSAEQCARYLTHRRGNQRESTVKSRALELSSDWDNFFGSRSRFPHPSL